MVVFFKNLVKHNSFGNIFPKLLLKILKTYILCIEVISMNVIKRIEYIEELKRWKDKDLIKVVTGIRRCGKSTLFEPYINYLKSIGL